MSTIIIKDLSFNYPGGDPLFSSLSLNIDTSWKLGLVGRNGRGKTTLLRLLEGTLEHTGSIITPFPLPYFPPELPNEGLNALELTLALRPDNGLLEWKLKREADFLKLPENTLKRPIGELSGGERVKVLLSILFTEDEVFPLIDEPVRNLDREGRIVVARYLSLKKGFILVSHDRELLDGAVDHIISLNPEGAELCRGNFSVWWENREREEKRRELNALMLKKDIKRLEEAAQKSSDWAKSTEKGKYGKGPVNRGFIGHKAAKMQKKSKNITRRREKAVEERREIVKTEKKSSELSLKPLIFEGGVIARATSLSAGYDEKPVLTDLSFTINQGDRLALKGPNGSGKSLLMKLLMGEGRIIAGELKVSKRAIVSFVPQNPDATTLNLREMAKERGLDEGRFKSLLRLLGFTREALNSDFSSLSLGQRKKAYLAASILTEAHLYLWDEPLANVDIISRMEIENLLTKSKITLVVCEHDFTFLEKVATSFISLAGPNKS
ncbi:MAG: ATP-binding cassette domain-containing protein [Deltaproteobacteria bacterium]|jgi:lincosamide and streptogramin A transport system ATP-binding/permease protein|nr:ATP-binding cassette domain-containing protein [Deltaproteobacteria bacterium]